MMKKTSIIFILFFTLACSLSYPKPESFEDKVATQASVAFTATALDQYFKNLTVTPEPKESLAPTLTLSPTATLDSEDPVKTLGQPNFKDILADAGNWFSSGSFSSDNTDFFPENGAIIAKSASLKDGLRWYLYYEKKPKNIYIEAKYEISTCSGNDQYGLVFRAPNMQDGYAYFYGLTCGGSFALRKWDTSGLSVLIENTRSDSIVTGSDAVNTLGVWAKDNRIRLYTNGQFLSEINDASLLNDGHYGLFINARETPGFMIKLDEISYWLIE